jgi:alpha-glucosidase
VRDTFDGIFRFWSDRGVAGFRIDVCNIIIKDAQLRDNPPATADDDFEAQLFGQRSVYNANRPEVHEVLRRWRRLADGYVEPRLLIGETPVPVDKLAEFYGNGSDELQMAFKFNFISSEFSARAMRSIVEETEAALPPEAWPAWTGSNHDMFRFPTRWAGDDPEKARLALLLLLSLRGTAVLYQGDEIGMPDVPLTQGDLRDPLGVRYWPHYAGRDAGRTPMQWSDHPGGGFTSPEVRPWLPLGDVGALNVEGQRDDPGSMLTLARDLIAFRRRHPAFSAGSYRSMAAPDGVWMWSRGDQFTVVLNMSEDGVTLPDVEGAVRVCTDRSRDGEAVDPLSVAAYQGLIVEQPTAD